MLKKDVDFYYKIIINVIYLNRKLIFYTIDVTTAFQVG